jgi:hypothetical protein
MPGGITGDSSVKWFMDMSDARPGSTQINSHQGRNGRGLRHEGVEDQTLEKAYFEISIELPSDNPTKDKAKEEFIDELEKALVQARAAAPNSRAKITFKVPIQDIQSGYNPPDNPRDDQYQIWINWPTPP